MLIRLLCPCDIAMSPDSLTPPVVCNTVAVVSAQAFSGWSATVWGWMIWPGVGCLRLNL